MKKSIGIALAILVLLLMGLLAVPFFVDVNDYREQIADKISEQTGRSVELGEIKASLFPWLGLRIKDVRVGNRSGFAPDAFITIGELDVQVALMPLLHKKVEVERFVLHRPAIHLSRNREGETNWGDLLFLTATGGSGSAPKEGDVSQAQRSQSEIELHVAALQVSDGRIDWSDALTGNKIHLEDLKLKVHGLGERKPVQFSLSGNVNGGSLIIKGQAGPLDLQKPIDPAKLPVKVHLEASHPDLKRLGANLVQAVPEGVTGLRLQGDLEQRPDGVRVSVGELHLAGANRVDLQWHAKSPMPDRIEVNSLKLSLNGEALLHGSGRLDELAKRPRFEANLQSVDIGRERLEALIPSLGRLYAGNARPWKRVKASVSLSGDAEHLKLRDLRLLLDDELVSGSGQLRFGAHPSVDAHLSAETLHLDPWLPKAKEPPQAFRPNWIPRAEAAVQEGARITQTPRKGEDVDLRFLAPWHVRSDVRIGKLYVHGLELRNLSALVLGKKGMFRLAPLRFNLSGGSVQENASMDVSRYPVVWREQAVVRGVRLAPVLQALSGVDWLDGKVNMQTGLHGQGFATATLATLNGRGKLVIRDGWIKGFDIAGTLRHLTTFGRSAGPKKTDFSELSATFIIVKGVARNNDLFMASPLFRCTGRGVVDLVGQKLDYHVKAKLVGTLVGQGDTAAVRKGLNVPLHIYGPFASLKVRPEVDPASLMENAEAIKGIVKDKGKVKRMEKRLQKSIQKLLPGF